MSRHFLIFVTASAVWMAIVLLSDREGVVPQLLLGGATAAFVVYFTRRSQVDGRQIAWAVAIATLGEIVLSLGWGLYSYRHAVIPLYVPPGHGLFYLLAAETAWKLTIEGHTDSSGAAAHNQALSEQRAASVKAYLVSQGVDAARLSTAGFGSSHPVADNASELGRAQNRRVELVKR